MLLFKVTGGMAIILNSYGYNIYAVVRIWNGLHFLKIYEKLPEELPETFLAKHMMQGMS